MQSTPPLQPDTMSEFRGLRKAELHAHFNGSIPRSAFQRIIVDRNLTLELPPVFHDPVDDMKAYLKVWELYRQYPSDADALRDYATAIASDFGADRVVYAELRHTVVDIATANSISLAEALTNLLDALSAASQPNLDLRLIVGVSRWRAKDDYLPRLLAVLKEHRDNSRLIGVDLSGDESDPVPESAETFYRAVATDLGLRVTIHAGELGSSANIRWAIENCRADRIGHALAAVSDQETFDLLRRSNCVVETCLRSNYLTRTVPVLAGHPVIRMVEAGIPVVLGTDNPALHGKGLSDEYAEAANLLGHDAARALADAAFKFRFGTS